MKNPFASDGLTLEGMINLICYENDIKAFLTDIKHSYRIMRAMREDPNDYLLNGTRVIDDIITRLEGLEQSRKDYMEEKAKEEEKE